LEFARKYYKFPLGVRNRSKFLPPLFIRLRIDAGGTLEVAAEIGCKNKQNLLFRKIFAQNLAYVAKNVYLCSVFYKMRV
jgi:hypothetical protein